MSLIELSILYALVGLGCAATFGVLRRGTISALDVGLLLAFWPLYGPFMLVQGSSKPERPQKAPASPHAAWCSPLDELMPDPELAARLAERLDFAAHKRDEIDRLLTLPEFSEQAAEAHCVALADRPESRAATVAQSRLANIRRLRRMRDQFVTELDDIQALITQLRVQAEVLRIAGGGDDGQELVHELIARVEGLDAVLEE